VTGSLGIRRGAILHPPLYRLTNSDALRAHIDATRACLAAAIAWASGPERLQPAGAARNSAATKGFWRHNDARVEWRGATLSTEYT